jgi:pyruvate,water dikinase
MKWIHSTCALIGLTAAAGCDRPTASPPLSASPSTSAAPESAPAATASGMPAAPSSALPAAALGPTIVTFDGEPAGAPSPSFEGVVGDWYVAELAQARGLKVDGAKWRNGEPSVNIADQAKRLYGDRYAEFLDGVKAFAFFPLAVWRGERPPGDIRVSIRFYPEAGRVDQAAGIAFAIAPDGSYLGARANALEDNILFFRVVKGKRTLIDTIRNTATPSKTWHTFAIELKGRQLLVELDGKKRFEKTLDADPVGCLGLWSKADSQVLFDDFTVTSLAAKVAP